MVDRALLDELESTALPIAKGYVPNLERYLKRTPNLNEQLRQSNQILNYLKNKSGIRKYREDQSYVFYDWRKSLISIFIQEGMISLPPIAAIIAEPDDWKSPFEEESNEDLEVFEVDVHVYYGSRALNCIRMVYDL